jgi:hypothetical protein
MNWGQERLFERDSTFCLGFIRIKDRDRANIVGRRQTWSDLVAGLQELGKEMGMRAIG